MTSVVNRHLIMVVGGAGYFSSLLVGELLWNDCQVTVVDVLLYGGDMVDIPVSFEKIHRKLGF